MTELQAATVESVTEEEAVILSDFIENEKRDLPKDVLAAFEKSKGKKQTVSIEERAAQIVVILKQMGGCTTKILAKCLKITPAILIGQRLTLKDYQPSIKTGKASVRPGTCRQNLLKCHTA